MAGNMDMGTGGRKKNGGNFRPLLNNYKLNPEMKSFRVFCCTKILRI